MCKNFYKLMKLEWNSYIEWCEMDDLVDEQPIRKNGNLRMAGSSKIGGSILKIDNPDDFNLEDTLIRIYDKNKLKEEQIITEEQLNYNLSIEDNFTKNGKYNPDIDIPKGDFMIAFKLINKLYPDIFQPGKISGPYLTLTRIKSSICPFSNRIHDSVDSYIELKDNIIIFGCYRKCATPFTREIGIIDKCKKDNPKKLTN